MTTFPQPGWCDLNPSPNRYLGIATVLQPGLRDANHFGWQRHHAAMTQALPSTLTLTFTLTLTRWDADHLVGITNMLPSRTEPAPVPLMPPVTPTPASDLAIAAGLAPPLALGIAI